MTDSRAYKKSEATPGMLAESERNYQQILNGVDHLVVLARQIKEKHPNEGQFGWASIINYQLSARWGNEELYRQVLSAMVVQLEELGYEPGQRGVIEGIVDPFGSATEPLEPPPGAENTTDG